MSQEHSFESKEFCCHFFGEVFQVSWFNELQTLEKSQKKDFYFFQRIRWKRILIYFYGSDDKEFADKQQSHVELGLERVDEGKLPLQKDNKTDVRTNDEIHWPPDQNTTRRLGTTVIFKTTWVWRTLSPPSLLIRSQEDIKNNK